MGRGKKRVAAYYRHAHKENPRHKAYRGFLHFKQAA